MGHDLQFEKQNFRCHLEDRVGNQRAKVSPFSSLFSATTDIT